MLSPHPWLEGCPWGSCQQRWAEGWKKLDIVHQPWCPGRLASPLLVQAQAVAEMMKDLRVWGFCWYPYPGFCECEGWVVSRHSVQSFIPKQLSTDHGPLSHIPFRGWIQSFFCSLSPFLIYGANIYSELLWACCWNAERIRDTGASLARCGLWETRERWVFRKGEWSGGILSQSQGVKAEGCSEALWEEGHWAFPQEHPVKWQRQKWSWSG